MTDKLKSDQWMIKRCGRKLVRVVVVLADNTRVVRFLPNWLYGKYFGIADHCGISQYQAANEVESEGTIKHWFGKWATKREHTEQGREAWYHHDQQ